MSAVKTSNLPTTIQPVEPMDVAPEEQPVVEEHPVYQGEECGEDSNDNSIQSRLAKLKSPRELWKLASKACKSPKAAAMVHEFEVNGLGLEREDIGLEVEPSLEATLVEKAQAAGKELNEFEQEYVRLQFEKNSLMRQYPNASARSKEIVKQIQDLQNLVKKFAKGRPKDDPLKLAFKSSPTKSDTERKKASRMAQSQEEREEERTNAQRGMSILRARRKE